MSNVEGKFCPLMNQECLMNRCVFFSQHLQNCEISILTYNLYLVKGGLKSLNDTLRGAPEGIPMSDLLPTKRPVFPRQTG